MASIFHVQNMHDFFLGAALGIIVMLAILALIVSVWEYNTTRRARGLLNHATNKASRADKMREIEEYLRTPGISYHAYLAGLSAWSKLENEGRGSSVLWRSRIYSKRIE